MVEFKQGEADPALQFTITDSSGSAVDVSSATLSLEIKRNKLEDTANISKADGDFDKTDAATGVVTVPITSTDTDITPGSYFGELKATFSASDVSITADFYFEITRSVH